MPAQKRQHDHDRDDRPVDGGRAVPDPEPGVSVDQPDEPVGAVDAGTAVTVNATDTSAEDAQKNRPVQTHLPKCPSSRFSAEKRFVA